MDASQHSIISVIAGAIGGIVTSLGAGVWWGGRTDARIANAEESLRDLKDTVAKNHRQLVNLIINRHAPPEEDDT